MRAVIVLAAFCASACAQQPSPPTDAQLAIWAHWASLCQPGKRFDQGNIVQEVRADPALKNCVLQHGIRATQATQPNAGTIMQESGNALIQGTPRHSQNCWTTPVPGVGWNTVCQ